MKNLVPSLFLCFILSGCNSAPQPAANANSAPAIPQRGEKLETVTAHATENQTPTALTEKEAPAIGKSKWTQSGDPIDTKQYDAAIAAAAKAFRSKPSDQSAKQALSAAYFKRAVALTDARQYASALGDYRRAVKNDPDNSEARDWIEKIMSIYDSMNREAPLEGQEPRPLPFKGEK